MLSPTVIAFEIFDELIESPAPLLGDSVKSIVHFSLEVSSSHNLEPNTRQQVRNEQVVDFSWAFFFRQLGWSYAELISFASHLS